MPSWNELIAEVESLPNDQEKNQWIQTNTRRALQNVSAERGNRNVIIYASAFLQKPHLPAMNLQLTYEEINGFMSVMHGMDWRLGLTLILHTPGGITNAAETVVSYLHEKFEDIEVVVPTFAMSAGTMIALGANRLIMGRQSQLGPIDPQMPMPGGRTGSARAIVDQFDRAKRELLEDLRLAHLWAPILQSLGPGLLQEAQNALEYGEKMVAGWLEKRMFAGRSNAADDAAAVASYFNKASLHKSHGRRIPRNEAREQGVIV
ncbi:MAG: serine protease, partial [Deltaproteobacteria bacterium]|nr:serine protease [Deltaproteobacteria bacterium]